MSLIEQAAKRLEQLRQAGVELPEDTSPPAASVGTGSETGSETVATRLEHKPIETPVAQPPKAEEAPARAQPAGKYVSVNLELMAARGLLVPGAARGEMAGAMRVIKRPLIANAMGKGPKPIEHGNLIMVTSALQGEGKTFTAINLAISIAMEMDNTVMLVDADVARPSVLKALGLDAAPGLLDVVGQNSLDISGVLLRTNIEKLSILPAGTQDLRATEMLASDAMVRLVEDMSSRYSDRIIIFDSPPLLLTTESRALATHMGQIVMVVQAENTPQSAVKQALAAIDACPLKVMVLNQARQAATDGYGYGYGYGYGNEKK